MAASFHIVMTKSRIIPIIILAFFLMSILSFEASALKAYDEGCTTASECRSGFCVATIDTAKSCGCATSNECPDWGTCDTAAHRCSNLKRYDAPCSSNSQCSSNACVSGRCGCASDANCPTVTTTTSAGFMATTQLKCDSVSKICKSPFGATCSSGQPNTCISNKCVRQNDGAYKCGCKTTAECGSGKTCNPATGRCDVSILAGGSSRELSTSEMLGLGSSTGTGGTPGGTIGGIGAACTIALQASQCQTGYCYNNQCASCTTNTHCGTGKVCALCSGICASQISGTGTSGALSGAIGGIGATCTTALQASQCQTGYCKNNKCAACTIKANCGTGKVCALCSGICASNIGAPSDIQIAAGGPPTEVSPMSVFTSAEDRLIAEINELVGTIKARLVRLRL